MQPSNRQRTASIHDLPLPGRPATAPASSELSAASEGPAPTNGAKRAALFAPAWDKLRSAGWAQRIADSAPVRAFVSTLKKALDDTQAHSQHDDKNRP